MRASPEEFRNHFVIHKLLFKRSTYEVNGNRRTDTSDMVAELLFRKIEQTFTISGVPKQKTLDYTESLKILLEMGMLGSVVKSAKQAEQMTIGIKTKFDSISKAAYSKEIADETIHKFSSMAPIDLNPKQKVRLIEILAASVPEYQASGRTSPALSQGSQADTQSTCDSEDLNGQGRVIWTHEAILLIVRRRELSNLFENNAFTQRQAWRKVADELQAKGYKYSEDDCSKTFRSLRARHKTMKEKNRQTGNSGQSWRYFDIMEEIYAGDPAVIPSVTVSSMRQDTVPSAAVSQVSEEEPPSEQPLTSTPRIPRKRRRSSLDTEKPPQWFKKYQQTQKEMHDERMALEQRRVSALETLVKLLQQKH